MPSNRSRVATSTLRKPWCSNPVSAAVCRTALCRPAVHLKGVSRSRAASIHCATRRAGGNASALRPPVLNFSRKPLSATTSAAASHDPTDNGGRQLDVHRDLVVEDALAPCDVHRGGDPAGVAGQVVGVGQRDLQAGQDRRRLRAEGGGADDGTGTAGQHHRHRKGHGERSIDLGYVDVLDDQRPDEVGVPLLAARDVSRDRLGERKIAGREDRGVVDEPAPGRWQCGHTVTLGVRGQPPRMAAGYTRPVTLTLVAGPEYDSEIKQLTATMHTIEQVLDIPAMQREIDDLGVQVAAPDLWDDQANATRVTGRLSLLQGEVDRFQALKGRIDDLELMVELANEEGDAGLARRVRDASSARSRRPSRHSRSAPCSPVSTTSARRSSPSARARAGSMPPTSPRC